MIKTRRLIGAAFFFGPPSGGLSCAHSGQRRGGPGMCWSSNRMSKPDRAVVTRWTITEEGQMRQLQAGVEVGGRVLSQAGRGLTNAVVTISDASGGTRTTVTGRSGAFMFDGV